MFLANRNTISKDFIQHDCYHFKIATWLRSQIKKRYVLSYMVVVGITYKIMQTTTYSKVIVVASTYLKNNHLVENQATHQ